MDRLRAAGYTQPVDQRLSTASQTTSPAIWPTPRTVSLMAIPYPDIDPVAISWDRSPIRWYGLAYITGLILGWRYTVWLARQARFNPPGSRPTAEDLDNFLFWAMAGVLVGGRLGIVFFYKPHEYLADPLQHL